MFGYSTERSSFIIKHLFYLIKKSFFQKIKIIAFEKRFFVLFLVILPFLKFFTQIYEKNIKKKNFLKNFFLSKYWHPNGLICLLIFASRRQSLKISLRLRSFLLIFATALIGYSFPEKKNLTLMLLLCYLVFKKINETYPNKIDFFCLQSNNKSDYILYRFILCIFYSSHCNE